MHEKDIVSQNALSHNSLHCFSFMATILKFVSMDKLHYAHCNTDLEMVSQPKHNAENKVIKRRTV